MTYEEVKRRPDFAYASPKTTSTCIQEERQILCRFVCSSYFYFEIRNKNNIFATD
jgi:hypothetical protein